VPLIKGALRHKGAAFLDVISPCVTFNNHKGSTKSFDFVREHNEAVNRLDVVLPQKPITAEYEPGEVIEVPQHDGTILRLLKLEADYDPTDRVAAMDYLFEHQARGEIVTGLLYVEPHSTDLHDELGTVATPLNRLGEAELCPGSAALAKVNAAHR